MITSLSTPNVILANERTGALGSAETKEWNCWARGAHILCPSQKYSAEDLLTRAKIVEPSSNLCDVAAGLHVELSAMSKEFPSRGARPLLSSLLRNDPLGVKRVAAQQYLTWARGRAVPLFEYWMALNVMRTDEPALRRSSC